MKNEMGSFFAFLFTELELPPGHSHARTHAHTEYRSRAPLSHTGNTKFIPVVADTRLAAFGKRRKH